MRRRKTKVEEMKMKRKLSRIPLKKRMLLLQIANRLTQNPPRPIKKVGYWSNKNLNFQKNVEKYNILNECTFFPFIIFKERLFADLRVIIIRTLQNFYQYFFVFFSQTKLHFSYVVCMTTEVVMLTV